MNIGVILERIKLFKVILIELQAGSHMIFTEKINSFSMNFNIGWS